MSARRDIRRQLKEFIHKVINLITSRQHDAAIAAFVGAVSKPNVDTQGAVFRRSRKKCSDQSVIRATNSAIQDAILAKLNWKCSGADWICHGQF
jgi:hypothetical protein